MGPSPARVLVTRPAGQERELTALLQAAGYTVFHQPLLELEPLPRLTPEQRRRVSELDRYRHVIFVSGNAVRFGLARIADQWPRLPAGITWYAVGETTARLLRESGLDAVAPAGEMSSEGLLAMPGLQDVSGQRVLIVKGEGGREALQAELARRGARVDTLACYRRRCPLLPPGELARRLERWAVEAVLISSGEGLANLLTLLSEEETTKFRAMRLVVPSARVENLARDAGFSRIATAPNASDAAMAQALREWIEGSGE